CGGFCPGNSNLEYTTIAPGKTSIILNDSSGTKEQISFGKLLSRSVGPRNKQAHATTTLKAGQLTVSVTIARHKTPSFVLIVEPDPYSTTTTTPSTTVGPALQHVVVTLTGGDGGDTGTLSMSPNPVQAGAVDFVLVDNRDNKIGTPQLFRAVHGGLPPDALGT